ncbi:hypothetical protein A9K97_gp263 [Tokyovirus A1]|uniref:hypothetical protein n=1 Tax=Tokyovirus A1 TaxID=1826170 RepID=UPI0007A99183|nr:hypothetical protein A9K97_gp263 [Tokyovirus A1]BAU80088.1 hypothetical protein [Tokyovirus A1]
MSFQCSVADEGNGLVGLVDLVFQYKEGRASFWINCCSVENKDLQEIVCKLLDGVSQAKHEEIVGVELKDKRLSLEYFCGDLTFQHESGNGQYSVCVPFDKCKEGLEKLCEELERHLLHLTGEHCVDDSGSDEESEESESEESEEKDVEETPY